MKHWEGTQARVRVLATSTCWCVYLSIGVDLGWGAKTRRLLPVGGVKICPPHAPRSGSGVLVKSRVLDLCLKQSYNSVVMDTLEKDLSVVANHLRERGRE